VGIGSLTGTIRPGFPVNGAGSVLVVAKESLDESPSGHPRGGIALAFSSEDHVPLHEAGTLAVS
jgi:aspartate oxidase